MATLTSRLAVAAHTVVGSASRLTHELRGADAALRAPIALSRRIGFVQLRGGSGASASAAYLANLLAARRTGPVLAVNAALGPVNLVWHAGATEPGAQRASDRRLGARSSRDARDGLPTTPTGLHLLDLWQLRGQPGQPAPLLWSRQVAPIARFYDVVVTDWGCRPAALDLDDVVATGHLTCLVSRADRRAAEEAAAAVSVLTTQPDPPRVALLLVDVGHTADTSATALGQHLDATVLTVPYDPARAAAGPVAAARLATRTRLAYTRTAAALLELAMAAGRPVRRSP